MILQSQYIKRWDILLRWPLFVLPLKSISLIAVHHRANLPESQSELNEAWFNSSFVSVNSKCNEYVLQFSWIQIELATRKTKQLDALNASCVFIFVLHFLLFLTQVQLYDIHSIIVVYFKVAPGYPGGLRRELVILISMCVVKGDWNGAASWKNRKKGGPCRCLEGHVK